ncbi:MAG: M20/M25/M40 family metallo-hydrolase [Gemmatimonadota bacterium]
MIPCIRLMLSLATVILVLTPAAAVHGQRPGGQNTGVDSTRYVRTTPATDPVIKAIWSEGMAHGQAMTLAQVFLDSIGPRLNNSDRFDMGQRWLIDTYQSWGIPAKQEQYGTWKKWIRGPTHVDLISPRVRTLEAIQLAWSPSTGNQWVEADVVIIPPKTTPAAFAAWLPTAKGKFVLGSALNPTCRSNAQVTEFGTEATQARITAERAANTADYADRFAQGGNKYSWPAEAGVAGLLTTYFSGYPGIDKIFGSPQQQVPTIDIGCEDYNLLYRLAQHGQSPRVRLSAQSQDLGEQPVHNVIARIEGSEKPNEYIVLSAHYDSWDGATGATDNGTGTMTMFEAARILKKIYPHPKRTIIIGHWGGEEQGLNGSRGFAEDHPEIVANVHAGFNQDNGTGRIQGVGPGPFVEGTDALVRYLKALPPEATGQIRMSGMGNPSLGGTDNASFQCLKSPVYGVGGVSWDYGNTTWHTNRDSFDKVIAEDLQYNATLVAMLVYMADQDPKMLSHEVGPYRGRDGAAADWPACPTSVRDTKSSTR